MTGFELTDEEHARVRRQIEREEVRNLTWLGLALTLIAGIGTWLAKWETTTFDRYVAAGPDRIAIAIECNGDSRAKVREFGDRIEVRLDQRPPANDQDCVSYHCVVLRTPLGDRAVVDVRTGREAIRHEESNSCEVTRDAAR